MNGFKNPDPLTATSVPPADAHLKTGDQLHEPTADGRSYRHSTAKNKSRAMIRGDRHTGLIDGEETVQIGYSETPSDADLRLIFREAPIHRFNRRIPTASSPFFGPNA